MQITRIKKALRIFRSQRFALSFIRYGVFAGAEHYQVLNPKLKMVIDIGANKGQFALACREWAPNAQIISFEPLEGPARVFKALFASDTNVRLHEVAIGPMTRRSIIHISAHEDSSSLLPIGSIQVTNYPGTQEIGLAEVEVRPLTSLLKKEGIPSPALIKLDVQGFEMEALKGCENLLECFEYIYCECSFIELYSGQKLAHEIIQWLHVRNFIFIGIFNTNYDISGQPIQGDFLFQKFPPNLFI
ncbi:FkbM family methyltransferase [Polynucleobacter paneuropaeus]|nr:FkbM family methyltransferase [Polynucleobacter paneuropaeus]MBT8599728.1 FkbM family methyltransferase [Polynucleobacter paneuropaeus]